MLSILLTILATATQPGAEPESLLEWTGLEAGSHVVGFQSWWERDPARPWRTAFDEGATYDAPTRPVLVNLWYPAAATTATPRMPHHSYLELPGDEELRPLADALADLVSSFRFDIVLALTQPKEPE